MNLNVDVDFLIKHKISVQVYLLCILLLYNDKNKLQKYIDATEKSIYVNDVRYALRRKFLLKKDFEKDATLSNILVSDKFKKIVQGDKTDPVLWIDDWFDLFPKGVKSGGYYVRTDKVGCLKKMRKFMRNHKYDTETIMNATSNYVDRMKVGNFEKMKLAPNFIEKEGVSMLDGECQAFLDNGDGEDNKLNFIQNEL